MPTVSTDVAIEQLLAVLSEAFEGPKQSWSYFTDKGAESGLLGALSHLNAAGASKVWGGTTIAAHAHHVRFGLAASAAWIAGDRSSRDWQQSWSVSTVDEAAWKALREQLRTGHEDLRKTIAAHAAENVESIGGALAAVAHAAYHLGAIRQKIAAGRQTVGE